MCSVIVLAISSVVHSCGIYYWFKGCSISSFPVVFILVFQLHYHCTRCHHIKKWWHQLIPLKKESITSQQKELLNLSSEDIICMYSCQLTKKMLLSWWRVKNVDSASWCLLIECTKEALCFGVGADLPRRQALVIRESSSAAKKGQIPKIQLTI